MRIIYPMLGVACLAACQPTIPDSAAGVGFGDHDAYLRAQSEQVQAGTASLPAAGGTGPLAAGQPLSAIPGLGADSETGAPAAPIGGGAAIAQEALAAIGAGSQPAAQQDAPVAPDVSLQAQPAMPIPPPVSNAGDRPNIVAFALSTTNRVGEQIYTRSRLTLQNHERNCAQFATQDQAQEEFLRLGGPQRDPMNLDPDGDGFACFWDPEPYRVAARAALADSVELITPAE